MMKEIPGSLRFMYYEDNAVDIARKIRDTNVNDIILMVNSDATFKILKAVSKFLNYLAKPLIDSVKVRLYLLTAIQCYLYS